MKLPPFVIVLAAFISSCSSLKTSTVELPRPNSGAFTFAQAEARKSEIWSLTLTPPDQKWRSDTFVGFAVHVDLTDAISVYSPSLPEFVPFPAGRAITMTELRETVQRYQAHLEGNPATILVTSELSPNKSKHFSEIIDLLFQPSIQLVYLKRSNRD